MKVWEYAVFLCLLWAEISSSQGWIENLSYETTCAEEDNVNVPIFYPGIERFSVIATHPVYCPCVYDGCPPDFSGCPPDGGTVSETCSKLWDDGVWVVEACSLSEWWRPYKMSISVEGNVADGHYLRVYKKIKDEASWPQVLALYEDGNMRIKPHPPHGISDVCFGSSVIVGPAQLAVRPYVDIQTVNLQPGTDSIGMEINYREGGSAYIDFRIDREQATANVRVNYTSTDEIPFATFRSMWVTDGRADVDHVANMSGVFPILSGWSTLEGYWWFFCRNVESTHNKSAPDIRIVIDTAATFRVERESGNVFTDGSYYGRAFEAGSADIAEWVLVSEPVEPGDVLEIDPEHPGYYRKARVPCSGLVAGVVSTAPGLVLGHGKDVKGKALLTLVGIVPVKVTDEGGAISPGDLLVVSSTPGLAMRWDPESGELCGFIGKALEYFNSSKKGVILGLIF